MANKLVSKLPAAVNIFNSKFIHQYYKQKEVVQNAFSFSLLSETEVCKMLKGLSPGKATGLMTYLQDLFVTVPKLLPTLYYFIHY